MNPGGEADLVVRCRRGEAKAWDEFFDRYYDPVARFVHQVGPGFTLEDVEDICQETFLAVVRSIASFRGASAVQTWVFRIALNKARDHHERAMAAKRGGGEAPCSLQAEDPQTGRVLDPPAPNLTPDAALAQHERGALLHRALEALGEPCREIIELRYFAELEYQELASTLELNAKTVSSRLSRCLDRLEEMVLKLEREAEGRAPDRVSGSASAVFPSN